MEAALNLPWYRAVLAGVLTVDQADTLQEHVWRDERGGWHIVITGLDEVQHDALVRVVHWFTAVGGVQ
jgi:hypothetical protein